MDQLTLLFSFLLTLHLSVSGINLTTFTIVNKCNFTVWPAAVSNAATLAIQTTGFSLQTGESTEIVAPTAWSGRFWGRTGCSLNSTGKFSCATGDCESGMVECDGRGSSTQPNTLVEFNLAGGTGDLDYFDVSLVDGYNLPIMVVPGGASGTNCTSTGCVVDVNGACPAELMVHSDSEQVNVVGCNSACRVFKSDRYCCVGNYNTPKTCKPFSYSQFFKTACPRAFSYAYDTTTFSCASADYSITFCPASNPSQKSLQSGSSLLLTNSIFVQ